MIKLVYVIVGVSKSEYLNMLRISLASARRYMPAIEIEIVTDEETGKALSVGDIPQKYNARIVAVPIEGEYTTVERSRVLKTNLRELVSGDFLYLDTDTIICEDFSDYVPQGSVNLVADAHCLLAEQEEQGEPIRRAARQRGLNLDACERYYNGGVVIAKDDAVAHEFFRKWHETWKRTKQPKMHHDQYSLNAVNMEMNAICELDGTWNCQLTANYRAFSYLRGVKILHYLSLQPEGIYRLNRDELMTSELTDSQIEELIDRPEQHFLRFYFYAEDSVDNRIMLGSHYHLIRRIYTRRPKLYRFGEKFFSLFRK